MPIAIRNADYRILQPNGVRRGLVFVANIELSAFVAGLSGMPSFLLLGGILGLLLSFADNPGPLGDRFEILGLTLLGLASGAALGQSLGLQNPVAWLLFAALVFAAGLLNQRGKGPHLAARFAALALAVGASIPTIPVQAALFLAAPFAIAAATRILDQLVAGPMKPAPPPPAAEPPSGRTGWTRFAAAYAAIATIALWFGYEADPRHVMWVAATTLILMLPDRATSYRRIIECMIGAVIGAALTWVLVEALHSAVFLHAAVVAIAFVLPSQFPRRFWLHTGLIAALILVLYDLAQFGQRFDETLLVERLRDVVLGCGLALAGTLVAFPRQSTEPGQADD